MRCSETDDGRLEWSVRHRPWERNSPIAKGNFTSVSGSTTVGQRKVVCADTDHGD
ncbi:hypothetical protein [Mariniradius sediminis]|uniref:Uncharacterized protein n=1 Tax=Mariniradius sediminis TaxID=2909237 RepID=A0ABS9C0U3_9BACT|nr:hypothetical protein [Mariniradius sediminis]MCF1753185.1 hypothetical protein [Mariniradius sediminis]